jgi:hypothetical protein
MVQVIDYTGGSSAVVGEAVVPVDRFKITVKQNKPTLILKNITILILCFSCYSMDFSCNIYFSGTKQNLLQWNETKSRLLF